MARKKEMSLLELILVIVPVTNAFGIDRFVMGDTKWGLIRLVIGVVTVGTVGLILWLVDLFFLITGKYNTDMLEYIK